MSSNLNKEEVVNETDRILTNNNISNYNESNNSNELRNNQRYKLDSESNNNGKNLLFYNTSIDMLQNLLKDIVKNTADISNVVPNNANPNNYNINNNNQQNIANINNNPKNQNYNNNNNNNKLKNGKTQIENEYIFGINIVNDRTCLKPFGDTSYLNSVLQCLGNIDELKNHFLYNIDYFCANINIPKRPFSFVFCRLFKHLSENDQKLYDLESFRMVLSNKNKTFKSQNRRNPIELLIFLLDILHEELNRVKYRKQNNNFDNSDRRGVIENGIIFFKNAYDSVISNNLNWLQMREFRCMQCNRITYKLSTFNTYELDIYGTSNYISKSSNITIYDCLNFDSLKKYIKCHCNYCNQRMQMESRSSIYSSPNIFIFLINRNMIPSTSTCNSNFNSNDFDKDLLKLNFSLSMNINLDKIENNNCPRRYELFGIVSINNSKYISFCKSSDNGWYLYYDGVVEKIEENNVEFYHEKNTFIPCILFYRKKTLNNN